MAFYTIYGNQSCFAKFTGLFIKFENSQSGEVTEGSHQFFNFESHGQKTKFKRTRRPTYIL